MASQICTRLLVLSDTHGAGPEALNVSRLPEVDVAIHCGDLTQESKLPEFRETIRLLKAIKAPLKLVIAGNHDFTLDDGAFAANLNEAKLEYRNPAVKREYGDAGEAEAYLTGADARDEGILFLNEGSHTFDLNNGAQLTVFASPYTPSMAGLGRSGWGFQYGRADDHNFEIPASTDVVITHGPPHGILDRADPGTRAGCPDLFAAVAQSRPLMHCFGHIHNQWAAKKIVWRDVWSSQKPSHLTAIDNDRSITVEQLTSLEPKQYDSAEIIAEKRSKRQQYEEAGYCVSRTCIERGKDTLFVNAAIEGTADFPYHPAWLVELELRQASERSAE